MYVQARYYEPVTGRFLSPDPAGGGYTYGFNNPIMFVDPDGLWAWSAVGEHASTVSTVAAVVAVGVVAGALIVGAPLAAPFVVGTLWVTGAVAFGAEAVNAAHVCGAGKGGCGSAIAMAGIGTVGGRYLRPLQAARQATRTTARPAPQTTRAGNEAFHYTRREFVESIQEHGLRSGSYATPSGNLSPLQAAHRTLTTAQYGTA